MLKSTFKETSVSFNSTALIGKRFYFERLAAIFG